MVYQISEDANETMDGEDLRDFLASAGWHLERARILFNRALSINGENQDVIEGIYNGAMNVYEGIRERYNLYENNLQEQGLTESDADDEEFIPRGGADISSSDSDDEGSDFGGDAVLSNDRDCIKFCVNPN